jgi:hypothetical protein
VALFDPPKNEDYPNKWKDMSLELKLMFVYHGCMMVLFASGGAFTTKQELFFAGTLVVIITILSLRHRSAIGWCWQGVETKHLAMVIASVALLAFFLHSATPLFPPSNPRFLPWYLAGFGIGTFNILAILKLVRNSESQMLADCRPSDSQAKAETPPVPSEPSWRRVVRGIYTCLFLLVWMNGASFFYYYGKTFRSGSPTPTSTQTDPISDHGTIVYVTHAQKVQLDRMETAMFAGIPSILVSGFVLHFLIGVKLFPNTPTLAEWRVSRSD